MFGKLFGWANGTKLNMSAEGHLNEKALIYRAFSMHLVGQLSNPSEPLEAVLGWVPDGSATRKREPLGPLHATKRLGNGVVQKALLKAVTSAGRPMGVREAQVVVEALLGIAFPAILSTAAFRPPPRGVPPSFERVAPGRYWMCVR